MCVDEVTADHPAHTAALQLLSVLFTEETKSRGAEVPTATSSASSSVRDMVNSQAAGRLCELLLQVCGGDDLRVTAIAHGETNKPKKKQAHVACMMV